MYHRRLPGGPVHRWGDTVFVAGEHDTTTDGVELYAADVPASHEDLAWRPASGATESDAAVPNARTVPED